MGLQIGRLRSRPADVAAPTGSLLCAAALCVAVCCTRVRADTADATPISLAIGPASYTLPRYPGAARSRTIYFPFIDAEYDNRFYMSASDLVGVYAYKTDAFQTGAAVELDPTRRLAQDDSHLTGLRDVQDTARLKYFASLTVSFVTVEENLSTDILGRGQGSLSQTNLWFTAPLSSTFSVNIGPGFIWADHHYMQSFYSVTAAEAARNSLLTAYTAHAGFSELHLNGLAEWTYHSHYRIGVLAYVVHLRGDAEDSPVTLQRVQRLIMGWVAYKFL